MTRTLSVSDTICPICKTFYDTVEEAIECERDDELEDEATREDEEFWTEYYAIQEQEHWEADADYLHHVFGP